MALVPNYTPTTWVDGTTLVNAARMNNIEGEVDLLADAINTLTTKGDIYVASSSTVLSRLAVGTDGQFLKASSAAGTGLVWSSLAESDISTLATTLATKTDKATLTAKGDIYVATAASTPARLGVGADGQFLKAASGQATGLQWAAIAEADVTNLVTDLAAKVDKSTLTTKGDIYVATAASTPARLGVGANNTVLTADSAQTTGMKWVAVGDAMILAGSNLAKLSGVTGTPDGTKFLRDDGSWQTPPGGGIPATIVDVKGDIIAATAADTVSRLAVGANGTRLTADSTQATGLKWEDISDDLLRNPFNNVISPTALSADVNNWAPPGIGTATVIRVTSDSTPRTITGIDVTTAAAGDGRVILLTNANASTPVLLVHDSSSSTAANRLYLGGATAGGVFNLIANQSVLLEYDGTSSRWRAIGFYSGDYATIPFANALAGATGSSPFFAPRDHVHPAWPMAILSDTIVSGSDVVSIDVNPLNTTFRHLLIYAYARSDTASGTNSTGIYFRANNLSTAIYNYMYLDQLNTTLTGNAASGGTEAYFGNTWKASSTANFFAPTVCFIPNYADASNKKVYLALTGGPATESTTKTDWDMDIISGEIGITAAISRLTFYSGSTIGTNKYKIGSRITVYGL